MPRAQAPRIRARRGHAFTLIELVVSLASAALIVGALASLMILAARAAPQRATREDLALTTAGAADLLAADLLAASVIDLSGLPTVRLACADRDGDGLTDVVTWSWDESDGSPLGLQRRDARHRRAPPGPGPARHQRRDPDLPR